MKNLIIFPLLALLSISTTLLADTSLWSDEFYMDGREIKEDVAFLLYPDDELNYSSLLAEGTPKSLSITVEDTDDPEVAATIFTESSDTEIEGVTYWDYDDKEYQGFPTDDTYTLAETVENNTETKVFKRTVSILPEPFAILALAVIGAFCLRMRAKSLLALLALAALCASSAKAESSVTEVTCQQMWPFDRSVVINYTIESDTATSFAVEFYGIENYYDMYFKLKDRGTLSRDGATGEVSGVGKHKVLWTPDESWYDYEEGNYIQVKVSIEEIKPNQVFEYELPDVPGTTLPVFKAKFYGTLTDEKEYLLEEIGRLENDGASGIVIGSGKHQITWFPQEALTNMIGKLELRVEYEDVTSSAKYLVLNLENNKMRPERLGPMEDPSIWSNNVCRTSELWLRRIEPGTFTMGSPEAEYGRDIDETQHEVTLTKAFYIGVFEMTQKQYEYVTEDCPSYYEGDERPVEYVSYEMLRGDYEGTKWPACGDHRVDKNSFFALLRTRAGNLFDLPTEAQWEYACRAGTTTALNNGTDLTDVEDEDDNLCLLGRYVGDREDEKGDYSKHTKVGSYLPNAWGLYDMHGNVWEWCLDWYKKSLGSNPVTDPLGLKSGYYCYRVLRGGSWHKYARYCRSASRDCYDCFLEEDDRGFRVVITSNMVAEDEKPITETFSYTVNSEKGSTLPVFKVKFYGRLNESTEYLLENLGKLENDGAAGMVLGNGEHNLTWCPADDYTNLVGKLTLRVEYEDVTEKAKYLVLDLNSNKMRTELLGPMEDASILSNETCRTSELWLRRIEPGTFTMGSPEDELGRYDYETQHKVTISNAFYMGVFETTQSQFEAIMEYNPSSYTGYARPVESVSYLDLRGEEKGNNWPEDHEVDDYSFFGELRTRAGNSFDLPTEAQWEFVCRAGTTTALNNGKNLTGEYSCPEMDEVGRYGYNRSDGKGGYTHGHTTVGSYLPNAWGLYDMHGNVCEWCLDWHPSWGIGWGRVIRGGHCDSGASDCRSAWRKFGDPPDFYTYVIGFRIVLAQ